MLCQLNEGKTLDSRQLAEQYGVSKRTIQRDINERLMVALPMLGLNEQGLYALPDDYFGSWMIMISVIFQCFWRFDLFPNMDSQFLRRILNEKCEICV